MPSPSHACRRRLTRAVAVSRVQVLFQALEAPDDDLKVLVMECLEEVPIDNLQAAEVANIVAIVADCDNLTVGRTEEILGHTFSILKKLAVDDGEEGQHFRRFHAATIHMALEILVRNSGRDTRGHFVESEEKAALSIGCVEFLRASSFDWAEAIELMQTRDAVEAMMAIMKNEEQFGRADLPIWIERTAVGSSVQALLQCLFKLDISGELAGRVLTRMAEVLEGRHTDDEIANADVMQVRDFTEDTAEGHKRRIAQHSLFVQVDGTTELMRYLLLHIHLSPTAYAPSGVAVRILEWAKEQQHQVDVAMVSKEEKTMDLPDIKVEGYEFLFTPHLHALNLDVAGQTSEGVGSKSGDDANAEDDLDQTSKEGQAVAAAFRVLLALLRYGTETTKKAVLEQLRDTELLRSLICFADDVTNGRWYPANVGPNLLLIVQDLCRLPSTELEENHSMVVLYDMITIMLKSALAMLEPKLDLVISQAKSAMGFSKLRPMGEQEERLMRNSILTYGVMCETLTHMRFADDSQVNTASRELAVQCLLPISQMRLVIRYLYYEQLLAYGVWAAEEAAAVKERVETVQCLTTLLAEHLCLNEDTRWELLQTFSRCAPNAVPLSRPIA